MSTLEMASDKYDARFWTCPANINGLARDSVQNLFEDDLFALLHPTKAVSDNPKRAFQKKRRTGPLNYGPLHDVVERRTANLSSFLRRVALTTADHHGYGNQDRPLSFLCLGGDSHNGGERPLVLNFEPSRMVLKFADPRPYQLLAQILAELSKGIGIELAPPPIIADPGYRWYLLPFLKADQNLHGDLDGFMFSAGALTSAAYCLRLVDLHLENVLVYGGKPIVIDPECILYNFDKENSEQRLLNTGLLGRNPHLSALRGGDLSKHEIYQFELNIREDGVINYRKPSAPFQNRARGPDGRFADPADFRQHLIGGYKAAFDWFTKHTALVTDIIDAIVTDDFRIRYLVRKTRHYLSVIHMLNLPMGGEYTDWRENVFQRFRISGHFPKEVSEATLAAELEDLESRDIPYFWVNAGERELRHRTGPTQSVDLKQTVRERAIHDIRSLKSESLDSQIKVLNDFLDIDMDRPMDPAE